MGLTAEPTPTPSTSTLPSAPTLPLPAAAVAPTNARNFHFGGDEPEEEGDDDAEEGGDVDGEPVADPEDDLETAFHVLDQAKVIYQRMDSDEARLKLANVHDALGEVLTESGAFCPSFKRLRSVPNDSRAQRSLKMPLLN